ncbi:hypothetical protein [Sphingomonas oryzagri]
MMTRWHEEALIARIRAVKAAHAAQAPRQEAPRPSNPRATKDTIMSRHPLRLLPGITVPKVPEIVIGWDPPLQTFFGYVKDLSIDDDEADPIILWVGTSWREVRTVDQLADHMAPWAFISSPLRQALQAEADADRR